MKRFHNCRGFTLIELLTVIVIIVILAALAHGVFSYIQNRAARARALTEIQSMETALVSYKTENGIYPDDGMTSGGSNYTSGTCANLNARTMGNPTSTSYAGTSYSAASLILYRALSGDRNCDGTTDDNDRYIDIGGNTLTTPLTAIPTVYMPFMPGQLKTAPSGATISSSNKVNAIADPFGYSYGYSTAYAGYLLQSGSSAQAPGYNSSYDLWSTAGNLMEPPVSGTDAVTPTWVTNW